MNTLLEAGLHPHTLRLILFALGQYSPNNPGKLMRQSNASFVYTPTRLNIIGPDAQPVFLPLGVIH